MAFVFLVLVFGVRAFGAGACMKTGECRRRGGIVGWMDNSGSFDNSRIEETGLDARERTEREHG